MMGNIDFSGQVAIITGAGQGLGKSYAELLASRGAKVIVNDIAYSEDKSIAQSTAEKIIKSGGEAVADINNISSSEGVEKLVRFALDKYDKIDILIHNAGFLINKPFTEMSNTEWNSVMDVHLNSGFNLLKSICPIMEKNSYGRVLFITSTAGLLGIPNQISYAAAKMGVVGLINAVKTELEGKDIQLNVLSPLASTNQTSYAINPSLKQFLKPELVAPMAVYLCSSACKQSGSIYVAGGGYFSRMALFEGKGLYLEADEVQIEMIAENIDKISDLSQSKHISSTLQAAKRILKRLMKKISI